jgi:hypothetical protein
MPFQTNGKRDYKREAQWEKTKKPQRLKDRVMRIQARRLVEKTTGNLPSSQHVDHKQALTEGGGNTRSNFRVVSASTNLHKEGRRKQRASR